MRISRSKRQDQMKMRQDARCAIKPENAKLVWEKNNIQHVKVENIAQTVRESNVKFSEMFFFHFALYTRLSIFICRQKSQQRKRSSDDDVETNDRK